MKKLSLALLFLMFRGVIGCDKHKELCEERDKIRKKISNLWKIYSQTECIENGYYWYKYDSYEYDQGKKIQQYMKELNEVLKKIETLEK